MTRNVDSDVAHVCLADLDDQRVPLESLQGRVVVLVGGGKGSMEQAIRWGARLSLRLADVPGVLLVAVAFIHPEPTRLVRGWVRRTIKRLSPVHPLLDWDGSAARALGLSSTDVPHVWLIDRSGILRARTVGACSDPALGHVMEHVRGLAEVPLDA